jgi:hypothetical protein
LTAQTKLDCTEFLPNHELLPGPSNGEAGATIGAQTHPKAVQIGMPGYKYSCSQWSYPSQS